MIPSKVPPIQPDSPISSGKIKRQESHPPNASSLSASPKTTDRLILSQAEREYQTLQSAISQIPDVRQERVERIRQALEAGTYQIPSETVAKHIIQEIVKNALSQKK